MNTQMIERTGDHLVRLGMGAGWTSPWTRYLHAALPGAAVAAAVTGSAGSIEAPAHQQTLT